MARLGSDLEILRPYVADALAPAAGHCLVLWDRGTELTLPDAVRTVTHWDDVDRPEGAAYDTVASVGQFGSARSLTGVLDRILPLLDPASILLFCEPTIAAQDPTPTPPHDVTTSLWRAGLTVIECRRARVRRGLRIREICWGRARLTPPSAPERARARTPDGRTIGRGGRGPLQ